MTRTIPLLVFFLVPAAAFAHPGQHLHPHGAGPWLAALAVGAIAAGVTWAAHPRR